MLKVNQRSWLWNHFSMARLVCFCCNSAGTGKNMHTVLVQHTHVTEAMDWNKVIHNKLLVCGYSINRNYCLLAVCNIYWLYLCTCVFTHFFQSLSIFYSDIIILILCEPIKTWLLWHHYADTITKFKFFNQKKNCIKSETSMPWSSDFYLVINCYLWRSHTCSLE